MKPGYVIVDTKIHDPETYEKYKALVVPVAAEYGAEYLARGGAMMVDQDELWSPTRLVLLKFPSMAKAVEFMGSEDYAPIKAIRMGASQATAVIFEGV